MELDCKAEEVRAHDLDRLREEYIRNHNSAKPVPKIGQNMANLVTALALTFLAKNGGVYEL